MADSTSSDEVLPCYSSDWENNIVGDLLCYSGSSRSDLGWWLGHPLVVCGSI